MPSTCAVPQCPNLGGHCFPKDKELKRKWVEAIGRKKLGDCHTLWEPTPNSRVCRSHFKESDYLTTTQLGTPPERYRLREGAVPSIFKWTRQIKARKCFQRININQTHNSTDIDPPAKPLVSWYHQMGNNEAVHINRSITTTPSFRNTISCSVADLRKPQPMVFWYRQMGNNKAVDENTTTTPAFRVDAGCTNSSVRVLKVYNKPTDNGVTYKWVKVSNKVGEQMADCTDTPIIGKESLKPATTKQPSSATITSDYTMMADTVKQESEDDYICESAEQYTHSHNCVTNIKQEMFVKEETDNQQSTEMYMTENQPVGGVFENKINHETCVNTHSTINCMPNNDETELKMECHAEETLDEAFGDNKEMDFGLQIPDINDMSNINCGRMFNSSSLLDTHVRITHTGGKYYRCTVCKWTFSTSCGLAIHMASHPGEKPYRCTVCERQLTDWSSLTRTDPGKKPYSCIACEKSFSVRCNLASHMRTHSQTLFQCAVCKKWFCRENSLTEHMKMHNKERLNTREKLNTCNCCGKSFLRKANLIKHVRKHSEKESYSCTLCEKSFSKKGRLTMHMKRHTGIKPHSCSVCEKSFFDRPKLNIHMRTHTGEKPYQCEVCGNLFSSCSGLASHMKSHTGEKKYTCIVCERSFAENYNLTKHMGIHAKKSFSCTVCEKSFSKIRFLAKHMKIHTGIKPHSCAVCEMSFTEKVSLTRHMRTHTEEKPL